MNQPDGNDDRDGGWLDARGAASFLGVKRETLYAYASRGLLRSAPAAGSRARRYLRADLERLKARRDARAGHGAVAAGALRWGEPVLDSAITRIDDDDFRYRGRSAVELAEKGTAFEEVAELLWGTGGSGSGFRAEGFGADARALASLLPAGARPLDALLLAVPAIAARDADRDARSTAHHRALLRRIAAAFALHDGADGVRDALAADGLARALLVALGGTPRRAHVEALNRALVLCADHELNPSSFAARVAASAGADTYACIAAALATLSGPAHGGATERVEALVAEAPRPERAVAVVRERLRRGETVAGFGHRLYAGGDPRAPILLRDARAIAPRSPCVRTIDALVDAMALAGHEPPTLDAGLVALAGALRLRPGSALAIFAAGRAAGWIAHVLEQRAAGFLLRPRARYVGAP